MIRELYIEKSHANDTVTIDYENVIFSNGLWDAGHLSWWHCGDTLKRKIHRCNLFKNLSLNFFPEEWKETLKKLAINLTTSAHTRNLFVMLAVGRFDGSCILLPSLPPP